MSTSLSPSRRNRRLLLAVGLVSSAFFLWLVLRDADLDLVWRALRGAELGEVLRDALASPARWIGLMGNPRHEGPHVAALTALGVPPQEIARVHRPIGLDIGSKTPPEIAVSTLAGLLADRSGRSGGFAHGR